MIAKPQKLFLEEITATQNQASDPHVSAWVSASAGSGKTKVLSDRVTRLLLDGVSPSRLLCLTFTKAAAAEMSNRLLRRLSSWATCSEDELDNDITLLEGADFDPALRVRARQLFAHVISAPGGIRIQTIHAFAQEVLRRFPIEAGLSPQFKVIEEAESQALWQESLSSFFEKASRGDDPKLKDALTHMVLMSDEESLRSLLKEGSALYRPLRKEMDRAGGFESLMEEKRAALDLEPGEDEPFFRNRAAQDIQFDKEAIRKAALFVLEEGSKTYKEPAARMLAWLSRSSAERAATLDDYMLCFLTKKDEPRARLYNDKIAAGNEALLQALHDEQQRIISLKERIETAKALASSEALLRLSVAAFKTYEEKKAELCVLDFDDLITRTLKVFARKDMAPWVLYKLDGGIDHILVDESQDTNPGQWEIVKTLVDEYCSGVTAGTERNRSLFVVGDEKQSIYSFQGADPDAFFSMHDYFTARFDEAGLPFRDVPLNVSFRSAPAVLRSVDAVFEKEEVREGVSRTTIAHQAFRKEGAGRVEVWPCLKGEAESSTRLKEAIEWDLSLDYETVSNPSAELAQKIASNISSWIRNGEMIFDGHRREPRPMNAGDVMVLVRNRTGSFVVELVRALKEYELPVTGVDRMVLAEQIAVLDLLSLLKFTLLPDDDLTLAELLKSPLIGASEEDLMALAIGRGKKTLWQSLQENKAYESWVSYLHAMMARADRQPPLDMLTHILTSACPADSHSGRRALIGRLGPDAEDPIDELLGVAENYGLRRSPSLQGFLEMLRQDETVVKRELEEAMGRVRITTVHSSKGLEAPVVILPDTISVPQKHRQPKIQWLREGEAFLPFYIPRVPQNAKLRSLYDQTYETQLEEYRRLLYVALTRAADRLIVCGYYNKKATGMEKSWYTHVASALRPLNQNEEAGEGEEETDIILKDYALPQRGKAVQKKKTEKEEIELPAWLFTPPPEEPTPPRPFTPSRPDGDEPAMLSPQDPRFMRGKLMHRLLQSLPDVPEAEQEEAARRFLAHPQNRLDEKQQKEIAREIFTLLREPSYAGLFGSSSRAEVPIIGQAGGRLISGQVDRLVVSEDEVWIVDFKTNRPPPKDPANIPDIYSTQMEAYRTILCGVYPDKKVRCFLLWTHIPSMMEVA